jgi:hypothetical protein
MMFSVHPSRHLAPLADGGATSTQNSGGGEGGAIVDLSPGFLASPRCERRASVAKSRRFLSMTSVDSPGGWEFVEGSIL